MAVAAVEVQAGVCGFRTRVRATSPDDQYVSFELETDCGNVRRLAEALAEHGPVDAYQEVGGREDAALMPLIRSRLTGCCAGCAVPVGLFKGMQVAAGLALPRDVAITIARGE